MLLAKAKAEVVLYSRLKFIEECCLMHLAGLLVVLVPKYCK